MRFLRLALLSLFVLRFFALAACISEVPDDPDPPAARLIAMWDPRVCEYPRRIVVELEHEDGMDVSSSAPCAIGSVTLGVPAWGVYDGRIYGWVLGEPIRNPARVTIMIDAPVIRWQLSIPP